MLIRFGMGGSAFRLADIKDMPDLESHHRKLPVETRNRQHPEDAERRLGLSRLRMLLVEKEKEVGADLRPLSAYANWYCFLSSVSTACYG
jgi:hypothetical protein